MIDTDKMKIAFAATPLCQNAWCEKDPNGGATKLCAISSLVSFAGVQPELIAKMQQAARFSVFINGYDMPKWVEILALPVLQAEYGIPAEMSVRFPGIFDKQENEWRGVQEVLALCERENVGEMHYEAIAEDALRFPQYGPKEAMDSSWTTVFLAASNQTFAFTGWIEAAPKKAKKKEKNVANVGKSKFWTSSSKPAIAKHHTSGLLVK